MLKDDSFITVTDSIENYQQKEILVSHTFFSRSTVSYKTVSMYGRSANSNFYLSEKVRQNPFQWGCQNKRVGYEESVPTHIIFS